MTNSYTHWHLTSGYIEVPDDIEGIDNLTGRDFELVTAKLLEARGYQNIKVTPPSGDFGTDIVAELQGTRYSIQVKCQGQWVSPDAVREAERGKAVYHCDKTMVVTNRTFMPQAKSEARQVGCILVGRDELSRWVEEYAIQTVGSAAHRDRRMKSSTTTSRSPFSKGDWVWHPTFGEGQVVGVAPGDGDLKVTVRFEAKRTRTFLASLAGMRRI